MESWRAVWRTGIVPQLTRENLLSLREALVTDDPRLLQGVTTSPPPMVCTADWPVEGGCLLAYVAAAEQGGFCYDVYPDGTPILPTRQGAATVARVEETFVRICFECDRLVNEPAGCRWFLNWVDETPRADMIAAVLLEVERALTQISEGVP